MDKKELQKIRNENYRYVDPFKSLSGESRHPTVRINTGNTIEHERKKFEICYHLTKKGYQYLTECHFKEPYRGIADIFVLDNGRIIEIMISETNEYFTKKVKNYPPLPVIGVRENDDVRDII